MATRPRTGKPSTSSSWCQTAWLATVPMGTTWRWGSQGVISAGCGENVDGMIQGDLAGSRVVLAHDVRPRKGWPVVQVWPGRADRWGSGRRRYNPCGKGRPTPFEESDGS